MLNVRPIDVGMPRDAWKFSPLIIRQRLDKNQWISAKPFISFLFKITDQIGEKPISQFAIASQASVPETISLTGYDAIRKMTA